MAVYTALDMVKIHRILKEYDLGELVEFAPISAGIENTNYFIWLKKKDVISEYVLTIFENISFESLPFFNDLTDFLAEKGFSVPAPLKDKLGRAVFSFSDEALSVNALKPTSHKFGLIVPKFEGASVDCPQVDHCRKIAAYIAGIHKALIHFDSEQESDHSISWFQASLSDLSKKLGQDEAAIMRTALARYQQYDELVQQCTYGVVHGDLFRDNVLFEGGNITGIIDFYHAGKTASLFDLAVIANDWAINYEFVPETFASQAFSFAAEHVDQIYNEEKLTVLIKTYASVKPLSDAELMAWPRLLELAAFRFWVSRLKTKYLTGYQNDVETGEVVKSPLAMQLILMAAMKK